MDPGNYSEEIFTKRPGPNATMNFGGNSGFSFSSPAHPALFSIGSKEKQDDTAASGKMESERAEEDGLAEQKADLLKAIGSYRPLGNGVSQARVLLLGPVGAGKSSFISSVQSVFSGKVLNKAMVGASPASFTKKLQSFAMVGEDGAPTGLVLCDMMGLGDGGLAGPTLPDILSVIKGHVPEGYKFRPDCPVSSDTFGYKKKPGLHDRIHCVAFVVDASQLLNYPKSLQTSFQLLREYISDLGVHQVGLLTHIDKTPSEMALHVTFSYKTPAHQDIMEKAASLLGMPTSCIFPVRNYSSKLQLNTDSDVLVLRAVSGILQYADFQFQDRKTQEQLHDLM